MKYMMLVCVDAASLEADAAGVSPWLEDVIARGIRLDGGRHRAPA
jgi:hypothetical protein